MMFLYLVGFCKMKSLKIMIIIKIILFTSMDFQVIKYNKMLEVK